VKRAAQVGVVLAAGLLAVGLVGLQGREPASLRIAGDATEPAPAVALPSATARPLSADVPGESRPVVAQGSLWGTHADGDWAWPGQGGLRPSLSLRRRFDHVLSRQGEVPIAALANALASQARRELPPVVADEVLALWARYLALQRHAWRSHADPRLAPTWRVALAERQPIRRQYLGAAWAEAFYGEEERELVAMIVALESGQAAAEAPPPMPPLHPEAHAREAAVNAEWVLWDRRIAQAREELARLRAAPELAAPQREAAINRWLAEHFSSVEQTRARALLKLPPP
jgi:lipase chaperone LimK